jgi:protein phosphatase 2C family protein
MGGHLGGARASAQAVLTLQEFLSPDRLGDRPVDLVDLSVAIDAAATDVASLAPADNPMSAPGTTLSGLMVLWTAEGAFWLSFNVGDSRAYVVGAGGIRQLTHDHSALQEARDLAATSGAPQVIPPANVVTKALGAGQTGSVKADYTIMPMEEGDRAVICTDGVHGVLQDSQIHAIVAAGNGPQGTADALVKASLEAGTRDNTTAVVVYAGKESRVTLTTNVMNRMIQPVRPASIQTARRVPRREGSD